MPSNILFKNYLSSVGQIEIKTTNLKNYTFDEKIRIEIFAREFGRMFNTPKENVRNPSSKTRTRKPSLKQK